jgi:quercetin dioxygenase-like cupin family protein
MKLARLPWPADAGAPTERALKAQLEDDGFEVFGWSDAPGHFYAPHQHPHDESIFGVRGEIVFTIDGREYPLGPGDRLMLPRGTVHTAQVGPAGASYLIGQRG